MYAIPVKIVHTPVYRPPITLAPLVKLPRFFRDTKPLRGACAGKEPIPIWVRDRDRKNCVQCNKRFKFKKHGGRHHCRGCGEVFCRKCVDPLDWEFTKLYKSDKSARSIILYSSGKVLACLKCRRRFKKKEKKIEFI